MERNTVVKTILQLIKTYGELSSDDLHVYLVNQGILLDLSQVQDILFDLVKTNRLTKETRNNKRSPQSRVYWFVYQLVERSAESR